MEASEPECASLYAPSLQAVHRLKHWRHRYTHACQFINWHRTCPTLRVSHCNAIKLGSTGLDNHHALELAAGLGWARTTGICAVSAPAVRSDKWSLKSRINPVRGPRANTVCLSPYFLRVMKKSCGAVAVRNKGDIEKHARARRETLMDRPPSQRGQLRSQCDTVMSHPDSTATTSCPIISREAGPFNRVKWQKGAQAALWSPPSSCEA